MKRLKERRASNGGAGSSTGLRNSRGLLGAGGLSGPASSSPRVSRHLGKTAAKFQFDLIIESIHGLSVAGNYAVKWGRGVKVASTKPKMFNPAGGSISRGFPAKTGPGGASSLPVSQKLTLLCTLYRNSNTSPFDEKDAKLSIVHFPTRGEKSIGKVHFNLAEFAGVPSSSTKKTFTMTNAKKIAVSVTIISSFMGTGSKGPGSVSGSSLSGLSMASSRSGASGSTADDLSDLSDDLSVPPSIALKSDEAATARSAKAITMPAPGAPPGEDVAVLKQQLTEAQNTIAQYQKRALEAEKEASELKAQIEAAPAKPQTSSDSKTVIRLNRELDEMRTERDDLQTERDSAIKQRDDAVAKDTSSMVVSMQQTQENLIRENEDMRKNNEELMKQLDEIESDKEHLEQQLNSKGASGSLAAAANAHAEEVSSLRNKITAKDAEINLLRNQVRDSEREIAESKKLSAGDGELTSLKEKNAKLETDIVSAKSKMKSHEAHSAKMKKTYQDLSEMYTKMRGDYMTIQGKYKKKSLQLAELQAGNGAATESAGAELSTARAELSEAIARETQAKEQLETISAKEVATSKQNMEFNQKVAELTANIAALEAAEGNSETVNKDLKDELAKSQIEVRQALDLVEKLRDEADIAFEEFGDTKRSLEGRCKELAEERDNIANEAERLRKRRGIETDSLKKDVERINEEMEGMRKKKNDEIAALSEARDNAVEQVDRLKLEHARRLRELEDEIDNKAGSVDAEQKVRTLEVQLTAARSREQNLDDEVTKMRTLLERKIESLKASEENLKEEKAKVSSLSITGRGGVSVGSSGLDEEVIHQLIETKLKLADSEEELLKYKNYVRKFKDGKHKQVLERIAQHASTLEVKLNEARSELAEYRSRDAARSAMLTSAQSSPNLDPD